MKNLIKHAYTLVELLVCIIIIALVIAAFAPIMTKRISNNKVSILGLSQNTEVHDLFLTFDDSKNTKGNYHECKDIIDKNGVQTIKCTLKNINASKINVLIAGAGGGGGGGINFGEAETRVEHYDTSATITTNNRMHDVIIHAFGPGRSGGSAYYKTIDVVSDTFIDSCPTNTTEVTISNGSKYCITDYNVRPKDLNQYENRQNFEMLPDAIKTEETTMIDITLNQQGDAGAPKCRITPEETCSNSNISNYAGCGRTVCNKQAADIMCNELDLGGDDCKDEEGNAVSCKGRWKLLETNLNIRNYCTTTPNNTVGYCNHIKRDGVCYCPSDFWNKTTCACSSEERFQSVRCSLLKSTANKKYIINSGAGGYSGGYWPIFIDSYIKEKCPDKICYLTLGIGSRTTIDLKDIGTDTYFYNSFLSTGRWTFSQYLNASNTTYGTSSFNNSKDWFDWSQMCERGKDFSPVIASGQKSEQCTRYGGKAANMGGDGQGTKDEPIDEFMAQEGGKGATGHTYNGVAYGSGGDGGSVPEESTAFSDSNGNPVADVMKGKAGKPGHIVLEYTYLYKGASGGGGGGGGYAMVKDIDITPNQEYEIQIGGGGKGGASDENGTDGGDTIVAFSSKTYIAQGGKGGKTGKPENDVSEERIAGVGGEGGKIQGTEAAIGIGGSQEGQRGTDGIIDGDYSAIGGLGGRSGISMSTNIVYVACGGLYFDNNIGCLNQDNHNGLGAEYLNPMEKKPQHIYKESSLGSYGAGGGGGGWRYIEYTGADSVYGVFAGNGGDGQGGYVYIWW